MWKRWVLSLELKADGLTVSERKDGSVMRWYVQDEVNQEDSEQNEVDGMKKGADSTSGYIRNILNQKT